MTRFYRGCETDQLIPFFSNAPQGNIRDDDVTQSFRRVLHARGNIETAFADAFEPRAQGETEQFGDGHGEFGVAMGINRQPVQFNFALPNGPLDGGACLPLIEHNRHVVNHAPEV